MINTTNRCDTCGGTVRNIDRKRHSRERLTKIHDDTCPGRWRGSRK